MTDKTYTNKDVAQDKTGNEDSRTLAKDWRAGKGNTSSSNFTTPKDKENPNTFDETMAKQGEKGFSGDDAP